MACTPLSVSVFFLMGLSALFLVIGMATNAMYGNSYYKEGLFPSRDSVADWWKASQAFAVLSLLVLAGAAVVSLLTLCCKDWGRKIILILQAVAFFGAAVCGFLCVIIFGAELEKRHSYSPQYSFALICVSAVLAAIAGMVCIVDMVKGG